MKSLVVGIGGKKRHGKNSVATCLTALASEDGIVSVQCALADALKGEIADALGPHFAGLPIIEQGGVNPAHRLVQMMDEPEHKERFRLLMQWWGTEFRRHFFGEDYWVNLVREYYHDLQNGPMLGWDFLFLVPDLRFFNEVQLCRELGGLTVEVVRFASSDGGSAALTDPHCSETLVTNWDYLIENRGSLEDLGAAVEEFYALKVRPHFG